MLKDRKWMNFPTSPLFAAPARGNPLECRDEIWRQKTLIVGIPDSQEITTLSSLWHNTGVWQINRQTDTLLSRRPA